MNLADQPTNDVTALVVVHTLLLLRAVHRTALGEGKPCPSQRVEVCADSLRVIVRTAARVQSTNPAEAVGIDGAICIEAVKLAGDRRVAMR